MIRKIRATKEFLMFVLFSMILWMNFLLLNHIKDKHIELRIEKNELQQEKNDMELVFENECENIFITKPSFDWR